LCRFGAANLQTMRKAVLAVAVANLLFFCIEFSVARVISSVSLFADSVDFLEDASINLLILTGLRWSQRRQGQLGAALAFVLLIPALTTAWSLITNARIRCRQRLYRSRSREAQHWS